MGYTCALSSSSDNGTSKSNKWRESIQVEFQGNYRGKIEFILSMGYFSRKFDNKSLSLPSISTTAGNLECTFGFLF